MNSWFLKTLACLWFTVFAAAHAGADVSQDLQSHEYRFFFPGTGAASGQKTDKKSPFASMIQTRIAPLLREARSQYRFLSKALSCELARKRMRKAQEKLEKDDLVRGGLISPASIKDCIYAAMVVCSLLGGPDPAEQGVNPLSSLAGKELTMPLTHFRKNGSENGAGGASR